MEASSPLVALRPKTIRPFGVDHCSIPKGARSCANLCLNDAIRSKNPFDADAFMDSSPTTDLVADISQNFYIEKTPQRPTPRRALFGSFTFSHKEKTTLSPIPSSPSPSRAELQPPAQESTCNSGGPDSPLISPTTEVLQDPMLCHSPLPVNKTISEGTLAPPPNAPRKPSFLERKKSNSLSRQPFRTKSGNIFKNNERSSLSLGSRPKTSSLDLEELFNSGSPLAHKEKKLGPAFSPTAVSIGTKLTFNENTEIKSNLEGSLESAIQRRPNAGPRSKIRRTMSMFDSLENVSDTATFLTPSKLLPITDSPENHSPGEHHTLPCFTVKDDPLRRIKKTVFLDILDNKYKQHYDEYFIVDCRFDYEYQGGHVEGAINVNTTESLEHIFFNEPKTGKMLIIFHCEFSACRAPRMAMQLRSLDRQMNEHRYPVLTYPDVYILDGGYSSFFKEYKTRCNPQEYVEMDHAAHRQSRERELGKLGKRRNAKLGRSQTYTFGARNDLRGSPSGLFGKRSLSNNNPKEQEGTPSARSRFGSKRLLSY